MRYITAIIKTTFGIVIAGVLVWTGYTYRAEIVPIVEKVQTILNFNKPCSEPITYSLVTFDDRFGITRTQFLDHVSRAATAWDTGAGKVLFEHDNSGRGDLQINLIYDYRQKVTNDLARLDATIKTGSREYDSAKAEYDRLVSAYNAGKRALDQALNTYNSLKANYENQVDYWNKRGGAPKEEYAKLEAMRTELNTMIASINVSQNSLNNLVNQVNAEAAKLNALAKSLNLKVNTYNDIGETTGREFDEGEYVRDQHGARINIYQYEDINKLVRVLEHELGHALGLNHVDEPTAIMYRLNQGSNTRLTNADLAELAIACELE